MRLTARLTHIDIEGGMIDLLIEHIDKSVPSSERFTQKFAIPPPPPHEIKNLNRPVNKIVYEKGGRCDHSDGIKLHLNNICYFKINKT